MGAWLTSFDKGHRRSSQSIAKQKLFKAWKFIQNSNIMRFVQTVKAPQPAPSVDSIIRSAPYIFIFLFVPKLLLDIATILKNIPIDKKREKERQADLHEALACTRQRFSYFVALNIKVPKGSTQELLHKSVLKSIEIFFKHHGENNSTHSSSTEDGTNGANLPFEFDEEIRAMVADCDFGVDTLDTCYDKIEAIVSNLNVGLRKLKIPGRDSPQIAEAADALTINVMLRNFFDNLLFELVCFKTLHNNKIDTHITTTNQPKSVIKKWSRGKPLMSLWNYERREFWWSVVNPRAMPKKLRTREHARTWRSVVLERAVLKSRWDGNDIGVKGAMVTTLQVLHNNFLKRKYILAKLHRSKTQKIIHAVFLLIGGGPWNWFMIMCGWLVTTLSGMLNGSLVYYRSLLLLTTQKVAFSGNNRLDILASINKVISAILVAQFAKIVIDDLSQRINSAGTDTMKKNLKKALGEKLLSQDLETFDERQRTRKKTHEYETNPEQLLRSFPMRKIVELPRTLLSVFASVTTTATLLLSKNRLMFFAVLGAVLLKKLLSSYIIELRDYLWFKYIWRSEHQGYRGRLGIVDALKNFTDVRINGTERYHIRESAWRDDVSRIILNRWRAYSGIYSSFLNILHEGPTTVAYILGCHLITRGTLAASDLAIFPSSMSSIIRQCTQLYTEYCSIYDFEDRDLRQLDEIVEILNEQPEIGISGGITPCDGDKVDTSLEFRNVAFNRPTWPLTQKNISFNVPEGSFVAICGKNGVGKSTLFNLVLRLYDPTNGSIYLGGRDIREYDPIWLRAKCVAMAPQKPAIYRGTLRTNMTYGSEEALGNRVATDTEKDAAIEQILARCGTLEMFKSKRCFPQGFDTRKAAREMSGGQRRGIGLARALFREPRVLLLDEPTNDLDPDVVNAVKTSLIHERPKNQTILCITHSLSTARAADQIILLGKDTCSGHTTIVAKGTYEFLMDKNEQFKRWHQYTWPSSSPNTPADDHDDCDKVVNKCHENLSSTLQCSKDKGQETHSEKSTEDKSQGTLVSMAALDLCEPKRSIENKTISIKLSDELEEVETEVDFVEGGAAEETIKERWQRLLFESLSVLPLAAQHRVMPQYNQLVQTMRSREQLWSIDAWADGKKVSPAHNQGKHFSWDEVDDADTEQFCSIHNLTPQRPRLQRAVSYSSDREKLKLQRRSMNQLIRK